MDQIGLTQTHLPSLGCFRVLGRPSLYCSLYDRPIHLETNSLGKEHNFIWKVSKPRRWWNCAPKNHLPGVRIQAYFVLKGKGGKSNISWSVSLQRGCVNFFLPAVIHRHPWSGYFLWATQRYFSLMPITWETRFSEMGHYLYFKFIGTIPLVNNL